MSAQQIPTWEQMRRKINQLAKERSEWAGMPLPVQGMSMVIHPSYPFAENLSGTFMPEPSARVRREEDVRDDVFIRNEFRSYRDGRGVTIWQDGPKVRFSYSRWQNSAPMLLNTVGAAR